MQGSMTNSEVVLVFGGKRRNYKPQKGLGVPGPLLLHRRVLPSDGMARQRRPSSRGVRAAQGSGPRDPRAALGSRRPDSGHRPSTFECILFEIQTSPHHLLFRDFSFDFFVVHTSILVFELCILSRSLIFCGANKFSDLLAESCHRHESLTIHNQLRFLL